MLVKATLPRGYPEGAPTLELQQTNLPPSLAAAFLAQAAVRLFWSASFQAWRVVGPWEGAGRLFCAWCAWELE